MSGESPESRVSAGQLRAMLDEGTEPLRARASDPEAGRHAEVGYALGRSHAEVLDALVETLWPAALGGQDQGGLALAGVGGYGRGAVALGADLDVRLLARELSRASSIVDALLYPMWDAGLQVGHQVVTVEETLEAAQEDLPTATALLDWRHVAGDEQLSGELVRRARASIFAEPALPKFLNRLEEEVRQRHRRFGGSVYLLEPDVKNGPGALRDLDIALWAARARWNVDTFADLVRKGELTSRQLAEALVARERLWRIRNLLHDRAGRRNDRLRFDEQEAIATLLGYADDETGLAEGVERLMSDYYRAARTVSQFRDLVLARARPIVRRKAPSAYDLEGGLQVFDGGLTVSKLKRLQDEPALAFRAVAGALRLDLPLRHTFRNAVMKLCADEAWTRRLRESEEAARRFVELVTNCRVPKLKQGSTMRELHDLGLLLAMVPEFAPVVGRVHHDTYHVYTVDVHSVAAVDRLCEIMRGDIVLDEDEGDRWAGSLACRVGQEVARPAVLFFATLLHDVGKSIGSRHHSERGAEMSRVILDRLGFSARDIEDVAALILHHLTMYQTATRRDLDDPDTWADFCEVVRDPEGLRNLYLLTVADLSTTSPTSMTSWKARMLDDLFVATDTYLRDGAGSEEGREAVVAQVMEVSDLAERALSRFLEGMPRRYALSFRPHEIAVHARTVDTFLRVDGPVGVALVPPHGALVDGLAGPAQICVVARDRAGLLSEIAAALSRCRLQVHAASIHSWDRTDGTPIAVDLFWVERPGGDAVAPLMGRLERNLGDIVSGAQGPDAVAQLRPARNDGPKVGTKVIVDNRAAAEHTVVEVFTQDGGGVLYRLARALFEARLSISLAKISTEGSRVVDVFYVTDVDSGGKVTDPATIRALRRSLREALERGPHDVESPA